MSRGRSKIKDAFRCIFFGNRALFCCCLAPRVDIVPCHSMEV